MHAVTGADPGSFAPPPPDPPMIVNADTNNGRNFLFVKCSVYGMILRKIASLK